MVIIRQCGKSNGNTIRLSLPTIWTISQGLGPGSMMEIEIKDDCLIIRPQRDSVDLFVPDADLIQEQ